MLQTALAADDPGTFRKAKHAVEAHTCSGATRTTDAPTKGEPDGAFWIWCVGEDGLHDSFARLARGNDRKWHVVRTGTYDQGRAVGTWRAWRSDGAEEWHLEFRDDLQPWQHEIGSSGRRPALTRSVSVSDSTGTEERLCPDRRAMSRPEDSPLTGCRPYGRRVDGASGEHSFHAPRQQPLQCGAGMQLVIEQDTEVIYGISDEPVEVQPMYCTKKGNRVGPYRGYTPGTGYAQVDVEGGYWAGQPTRRWTGTKPVRWNVDIEGGELRLVSGLDEAYRWEIEPSKAAWAFQGTSPGGSKAVKGTVQLDGGLLNPMHIVRTGTWTFFHDNGKKRSEGEYVEGKRTGTWHFYTTRGAPVAEGEYVDDKREGEWTLWDALGEPRRVVYQDGVSGEDRARDAMIELLPSVDAHILKERRDNQYVPDKNLPDDLCAPFRSLHQEWGEFAVLLAASGLCEERYPSNVELEDRCRNLAAARCF